MNLLSRIAFFFSLPILRYFCLPINQRLYISVRMSGENSVASQSSSYAPVSNGKKATHATYQQYTPKRRARKDERNVAAPE